MKENLDLEFVKTCFVLQLCHGTLVKSLVSSGPVSSSMKQRLFDSITEHVPCLTIALGIEDSRLCMKTKFIDL